MWHLVEVPTVVSLFLVNYHHILNHHHKFLSTFCAKHLQLPRGGQLCRTASLHSPRHSIRLVHWTMITDNVLEQQRQQQQQQQQQQ
jgi:hypothetical protein